MRPLPLAPIRDAPRFVLGLSVIRGTSVPVVDLGALLGRAGASDSFGRFATLHVDGRFVALAVQAVTGVVELAASATTALPPLLEGAANDAIDALALHDSALLLILRATHLVPEERAAELEEAR